MVDNEEKYFADCEEDPDEDDFREKYPRRRLYTQVKYKTINLRPTLRWESVLRDIEYFLEGLMKTTKNLEMYKLKKKRKPFFKKLGQKKTVICADEDRIIKVLSMEANMLDKVNKIQRALSIEVNNWRRGLTELRLFQHLTVSPYMLKRSPRVVFTIRKLLLYNGNDQEWDSDEDDMEEYARAVRGIRENAWSIYKSFQRMWRVPPMHRFLEVFKNEAAIFEELMEDLRSVQRMCQVEDPLEWVKQIKFQMDTLKKWKEDEARRHGFITSSDAED